MIQGLAGHLHRGLKRIRAPRHVNAGGSVQENDFPLSFRALSFQNSPQDSSVLGSVPALNLVQGPALEPEVPGVQPVGPNGAALELGDPGRTRYRDLVQAVLRREDESVFAPQRLQHLSEHLGQAGSKHPDDLATGSGRIEQGPQQVEDGSHGQIAPQWRHHLHGLMKERCEQKGDAAGLQAVLQDLPGSIDSHAQLGQHVRAAALA